MATRDSCVGILREGEASVTYSTPYLQYPLRTYGVYLSTKACYYLEDVYSVIRKLREDMLGSHGELQCPAFVKLEKQGLRGPGPAQAASSE